MAGAGRLVVLQVAQRGYSAATTRRIRARPTSRAKVRYIARNLNARGNVVVTPLRVEVGNRELLLGSRVTNPHLERRVITGRLKGCRARGSP